MDSVFGMNLGPKCTLLSVVRGVCACRRTAGHFNFIFFLNMSDAACSFGVERAHLPVLLGFSKSSLFIDEATRQRPISGEGVCELCVTDVRTRSLKVQLKNREMSLWTNISPWHCTL